MHGMLYITPLTEGGLCAYKFEIKMKLKTITGVKFEDSHNDHHELAFCQM